MHAVTNQGREPAQTFSRRLAAEIGEVGLFRIRIANVDRRRAGDDGSCASHDLTDANAVMDAAFEAVVGRDIDAASMSYSRLVEAAWREALG